MPKSFSQALPGISLKPSQRNHTTACPHGRAACGVTGASRVWRGWVCWGLRRWPGSLGGGFLRSPFVLCYYPGEFFRPPHEYVLGRRWPRSPRRRGCCCSACWPAACPLRSPGTSPRRTSSTSTLPVSHLRTGCKARGGGKDEGECVFRQQKCQALS